MRHSIRTVLLAAIMFAIPAASFAQISVGIAVRIARQHCRSTSNRYAPVKVISGRLVIGPTEMMIIIGFPAPGCWLPGRRSLDSRLLGWGDAATSGTPVIGDRTSDFTAA